MYFAKPLSILSFLPSPNTIFTPTRNQFYPSKRSEGGEQGTIHYKIKNNYYIVNNKSLNLNLI